MGQERIISLKVGPESKLVDLINIINIINIKV
jgi:hypothetical protein